MSCLTAGFSFEVTLESAASIVRNFVCRAGFVCGTGLGNDVLWASDEVVLTVDGDNIYLTKKT